MTILNDRLPWLEELVLDTGGHSNSKDGFCVMEAAAYIAGEPWSDHPECASPVITSLLIGLNDRWSNDDRQLLKPYVVKVVGTKTTDADEETRRAMIRDWIVHTNSPLVFRRAGHEDLAARFDALPRVTDVASWEACRKEIYAVRDEAWGRAAAADAAADAVADAVADAAADAAAAAVAVAVAVAVAAAAAVAVAAAAAAGAAAGAADAGADAGAGADAAARLKAFKAAADAAATNKSYWDKRNAAYAVLRPYYDQVYADLAVDVRGHVFDLLDRLCEVGRS